MGGGTRSSLRNNGRSNTVTTQPSRQCNINIPSDARLRIMASAEVEDLRNGFGGDSPAPPRNEQVKRVPIQVEGFLIDHGPLLGIVFECASSLSADWTRALDACAGKISLQSSNIGRSDQERHTI